MGAEEVVTSARLGSQQRKEGESPERKKQLSRPGSKLKVEEAEEVVTTARPDSQKRKETASPDSKNQLSRPGSKLKEEDAEEVVSTVRMAKNGIKTPIYSEEAEEIPTRLIRKSPEEISQHN